MNDNIKEYIKQRKRAIVVARSLMIRKKTQKEFIDLIESNYFSKEINDIFNSLKQRGEMNHLISWVWTFKR